MLHVLLHAPNDILFAVFSVFLSFFSCLQMILVYFFEYACRGFAAKSRPQVFELFLSYDFMIITE